MLIDSHCHINSEPLREQADEVVKRARDGGVEKLFIIGCDLEDSREAVSLAENFSQYASVGIHPHEAKRFSGVPEEFCELIKNHRVVAVGEIGLDYHYDHSPRDVQQKIFEEQIIFAAENNMPVILHIREAMNDAMKIIRRYKNSVRFLFHCYSGGLEFLDEVISMGSMCAFGGAITWKNQDELREVVRRIPSENILLETDCPYMSPVPFRGKVNEPAYIKYVYEAAAKEKNISVEDLAQIITRNTKNFFGV